MCSRWSRIVVIFVFVGFLFLLIGSFKKGMIMRQAVDVWGWQYSPYSTDPMDYDDVVHHIAWTSVLGTLVSNYKVGEIVPQIAERWTVSDDLTEWTFMIRKQCFFDDGSSITPKEVASSFKRIALQQRKNGSRSGITENLVGFNNLENMESEIPGIQFDEDFFKLKFSKPQIDTLSKISFGLYSIVHPSQYDVDGVWKDKKKVISSGPYRVTSWSEDKLSLALNELQADCYSLSKNNISELNIHFGNPQLDTTKQLIVSGSSKSLMIDDTFDFLGPADADIMYLRVYKDFGNIRAHEALRDVVVKEFSALKNINFSLSRSFFPLAVKGAEPGASGPLSADEISILKGIKLRVPAYKPSNKALKNRHLLSYTDAFNEVMNILEKKYEVEIIRTEFQASGFGGIKQRAVLYDMEMLLTGIVVGNPYEDIRFMFRSKEGIQLPDIDGSIGPLLNNVESAIKEINDKIWAQSRIIPLTHYSSGLWFKKGHFNTDSLDHTRPPTNFQFISFR